MDIKQLLQYVIDVNASDLHLVTGIPPTLRIEGELAPIPTMGVLTPDVIVELFKQVLTSEQLERLTVNKEIDFSLAFSDKARFRVNAYYQRGSLAGAFRKIPTIIPTIDSLGLPKIVHSFTTLKQGFVLVTGPTGQGKSTTLAAILNEINSTDRKSVV